MMRSTAGMSSPLAATSVAIRQDILLVLRAWRVISLCPWPMSPWRTLETEAVSEQLSRSAYILTGRGERRGPRPRPLSGRR